MIKRLFSKKTLLIFISFVALYFTINQAIIYLQKKSVENKQDIVEANGINFLNFYIGQNADTIINGNKKRFNLNAWWEVKKEHIPEQFDMVYVQTFVNTKDIEKVGFLKKTKNQKECIKLAQKYIKNNKDKNFYYSCGKHKKNTLILIFYNHQVFIKN